MIETGKYNDLKIIKESSFGLYLADESGEEVLLPIKYCPEDYKVDEIIRVFVYLDAVERKIATTQIPKITLHQFAYLQAIDISNAGAFLNWGMDKDLFVPFSEQKRKMEEGKWYIVYLDYDKTTDRLFASNKVDKYLQNEDLTIEEGEEVDLLVMEKTDLGFSVIINQKHKGLVFANEIFMELKVGDHLTGYVKKIREDNKVDISLQPIGYKNFNDVNVELVYNALEDNEGYLPFTDKSSPDDIYEQFGISKKAFKKAIGALYKERKINIESGGIKLI